MAGTALPLSEEELLSGSNISSWLEIVRGDIQGAHPLGERFQLALRQWKSGHPAGGAIPDQILYLRLRTISNRAAVYQRRPSISARSSRTMTSRAHLAEQLFTGALVRWRLSMQR